MEVICEDCGYAYDESQDNYCPSCAAFLRDFACLNGCCNCCGCVCDEYEDE